MTSAVSSQPPQQHTSEKNNIMNGIKKVFHRNSTTSEDGTPDDLLSSPRSATSNLSSDNATSVDSHDTPARGTKMTGAVAGTNAASKTGNGRSELVSTATGENRHSHGHGLSNDKNVDLTQGKVTQTVEHLAGVTDKTNHTHRVEEVTRQKTLERHQHHIQVHHQPIKHETHEKEKLTSKQHPVTNISEKHASTDKDAALLASVAHSHDHKERTRDAPVNHQIVDKGERVTEHIHHHIHNVVVPLISHDNHAHERIQTVIPSHHVVHEAPIIHQATTLEPVSQQEFLQRGGSLANADKKHVSSVSGLLHDGTCERKVDGVAEKLAKEMKLGNSTTSSTTAASKAQVV